ncbi:MAG TPA: hypothetical protein VJN18_13185 [Polyangiaceae bacterium]|nr:hypothetical protein [Polyangiaceae bacterium]
MAPIGRPALAPPLGPPRFVRDEPALADVLLGLKLARCPHCRQCGALIGHGLLLGYAERTSEVVVRGRRVFCSNRGQRPGCGRTYSVLLSTVLYGFVVGTLTLFRFASAVMGGLTRRAAWLGAAAGALSLSSGYRLWRRLVAAQSWLRWRLCREAPAPACAARQPLAQLFGHVGVVVGTAEPDLLEALQRRLQRGLFER